MKGSCLEISTISLWPTIQRADRTCKSQQPVGRHPLTPTLRPHQAPSASAPLEFLLFLQMHPYTPLCCVPTMSPEKVPTDHLGQQIVVDQGASPGEDRLVIQQLLFDKPCSPSVRLARLSSLEKHTRIYHNSGIP